MPAGAGRWALPAADIQCLGEHAGGCITPGCWADGPGEASHGLNGANGTCARLHGDGLLAGSGFAQVLTHAPHRFGLPTGESGARRCRRRRRLRRNRGWPVAVDLCLLAHSAA